MHKKNYLFNPFKDDDEKIDAFNHIKRYLPKGHLNELIIFMGRLEAYYDVIISTLKVELEQLELWSDEVVEPLQAKIKSLQADITHDAKVCYDMDDEHIKRIKELEADNERLNSECWCGCNDNLRVEYIRLINDNKKRLNEIIELQAENKRLSDNL